MTALLKQQLIKTFGNNALTFAFDEITLTVNADEIHEVCLQLRDNFLFETLMDLCAVDYSTYGQSEWVDNASACGFSRGCLAQSEENKYPQRFAVVYHLLSISNNNRLRVKVFVGESEPMIESVTNVWASADWYEREAFDLMGILFKNHTDLRRILTDYGFIGHPLRKDFPMIGEVEMFYDETLERVVYQKVSIEPNINVPRVIRQ